MAVEKSRRLSMFCTLSAEKDAAKHDRCTEHLDKHMMQNMLQNLANSIRNISKTEQLQATNWITKVSDTHTLSAKNSVQVADGELKLDAKRIHMG